MAETLVDGIDREQAARSAASLEDLQMKLRGTEFDSYRLAILCGAAALRAVAGVNAVYPRTPEGAQALLDALHSDEGVAVPPAYEVVYFRRRPDEPEDWLRVPAGTAKQHVREELITRVVPAPGVALPAMTAESAFSEYLKLNPEGRQRLRNHIGYKEEEWLAFEQVWNTYARGVKEDANG